MLHIGCHLSSSKGFLRMGEEALSIKADTFQFFTRNPRGSKAKAVVPEDAQALVKLMAEHHFAPVLAHAPYTLNPCSAEERVRDFTAMTMAEDLAIMDQHLPGNYYNFHPGSHVGQGIDRGIDLIADILNAILKPGQKTLVLLETMSGKGSEVGGRFEELAEVIGRVHESDNLGICLDTCHVFSAGYDIIHNLDGVLADFDAHLRLDRLKAIHLNDSLTPFDEHKDRHAKIGEGKIGFEAIARLVNHPKLRHLPFYLETPNDVPGYAHEIAMLREAYREL